MNLAQHYWEAKKFFCKIEGDKLVGQRGSEKQNLTAMEITKLFSTITVEFEEDNIHCTLDNLGIHQVMTRWGEMGHKLELLDFEKALSGKSLGEIIQAHKKEKKHNMLKFMMNGGKASTEVSPELNKMFNALSSAPSVKVTEIDSPYPTENNNVKVEQPAKFKLSWKYLAAWMMLVLVFSFFFRIYQNN